MDNMKIAVVSDSHDNTDHLERVAVVANEYDCSYLFHLGDITSPSTAQRLNDFKGIVKAVYGNCDGDIPSLKRTINTMGGEIQSPPFKVDLEGKKIILLHEPFHLEELAKSQEADYIFYGHLHRIDERKVGKTHILNPGESGGWVNNPSFFIVDMDSGLFEQISL